MATNKEILIAIFLFSHDFVAGVNNKYEINIQNEDNTDICDATGEWIPLKHENEPIQNVCVKKNHYANHPPRKSAPVLNFYRSINVINIDEKQKMLTINIKMFSLWEDARIKARFVNNESIILPPCTKTRNNFLIWTSPLQTGSIDNLKEIRYLRDPTVFNWIMLHPYMPIDTYMVSNIFAQNSTFVSSEIEWEVTILCDFDFSRLPFDSHVCKFRMISRDVNVTMKTAPTNRYRPQEPSKETNEHTSSISIDSNINYLNEYSVNGFKVTIVLVEASFQYQPAYKNWESIYGFDIKLERRLNPYIYQYYLTKQLERPVIFIKCVQ